MVAQAVGVVTPEAVRLEFEGANLGTRCLALLVDLAAQFAIAVVVTIAAVALSEGIGSALPGWVAVVLVLLTAFAIIFGYPIGFETLMRGRTPGKAALGLRVVTVEGAPIRFRHAALRGILALVDFYLSLGGIACLTVLLSARQQRLGDLVAGTLVLRERTAAGRVEVRHFEVPPGAEAYAATVDTGGMTAQEYATVRSFLLRAPTLGADARVRVGSDLARRLAASLAHTPPQGVSPELFLLVVAAGYQRRSRSRPEAWRGSGDAAAPPAAPPAPPAAPPPPPAVPAAPPAGAVPPSAGAPPAGPDAPVAPPVERAPQTVPGSAGSGGGFIPPA